MDGEKTTKNSSRGWRLNENDGFRGFQQQFQGSIWEKKKKKNNGKADEIDEIVS